MSVFINSTKRSADELLADLNSCRQFRHMSERAKMSVIDDAYLALAKAWMGHKAIKHPDPNNLCQNCGDPRSKLSGGATGLCFRCYACKGIETRELWIEDVFWQAVAARGFTCDACGKVHKPDDQDEQRFAIIRMLDSIDGAVKPVLCPYCFTDFKSFCSRNYGTRSWRTADWRTIEKMSIAWFAQKVKVLAERVTHQRPSNRRNDDRAGVGQEHSAIVKLKEIAL